MKLRYYLRGLGIGILITTIILSISLNGRKESLSNEEIIERAKGLGMIQQEETSLKDVSEEETSKAESKNAQELEESQDSQSETEKSQAESEKDTMDKKEDSVETSEETSEEANVTKSDERELVQVDVQGGQSSDVIATVLFNAKLVEDAVAFNSFLVDKKYDVALRVGTFSIPKGATYEEIAKILTSK